MEEASVGSAGGRIPAVVARRVLEVTVPGAEREQWSVLLLSCTTALLWIKG